MDDNQNLSQSSASRQTATAALAVVGFIALVALGMWLAISASRYVPGTVSRIGAAAVALGSVFSPAQQPPASTASSTPSAIVIGNGASSTPATSTPAVPDSVPTTPGQETSQQYQISGDTAPLSGLPDLSVTVSAVGYLTTNSTSSFVPASSVPAGNRPAVEFTVKNIGTNAAGAWTFLASIPTTSGFVYTSLPQQALNPGDSIDYTLGFDSAAVGSGKQIMITVNSTHAVAESSYANNVATAIVNVQ
ncbi:MAG TPA: CARDB domain-containing protein [Candidatus Paceibacterota bacterium]|nr:CARDB domain-containing protein [Candidatus Paceibacterota bacterium]